MNSKKEEIVGGVLGAATTVGVIGVSASGASAATMAAGLASAGAIVGGGMAAGIVVAATAPLAVGGAVFGVVKAVKHLKKEQR